MILISTIGQFFCGMACVTSCSRTFYAFSRDRAVPGWRLWSSVDKRHVPVAAVIGVCVFAAIITLPALWNVGGTGLPVAFFAVVSISVIGLYIAYVMPVYLRLRAGDAFVPGAWTLGAKYKWMCTVSVIWVILMVIIFSLPFTPAAVFCSDEFDWKAVNYAPLMVGALFIAVGVWWLVERQEHVHRPGAHDRVGRGRGHRRGRAGRGRGAAAGRRAGVSTLTVLEPATEQVLAEIPRAGVEEADAAVARAKAAYPAWRALAPGRPRAAAAPPGRRAGGAPRGARGARGAQRRQADRRRARRDGHGGRHVPLLRRRRPSATSATRSRCAAAWR